ncbi:MAG TPA: efflux RND transporter periplasmic adaptor subunit [Thermoanaerobaculia bacterium]|nr:efflux RND transporter periplasmic adaptor subunit [Thermoanaerobaculia bacterium]
MLDRFRTKTLGRPPRAAALLAAAVLGLAVLAGCAGAGAEPPPAGADTPSAGGELIVRRGDFQRRLVLTGELRAARAVDLTVPQSPSWRVQIQWLEEDGAEVAAGQRVVEFDNTQFAADLEQKRAGLRGQEQELARTRARGEVTLAERRFAIDKARAELEKATILAEVPEDLLSPREYQDRQLARKRAEIALEKANEELASARAGNEAELAMKRLDIDRARREIAIAEQALEALVLRAPEDGIFVVEENRFEQGRKLQQGDMAFVGMTVARLPELDSMQVEAMLSDVDDGEVAPGMEARCTLDAYPETVYPCRVLAVSPVAREAARSSLLRFFQVDLDLGAADVERMRPGMSVKVEVETEARPGVLLAPRAALDESAEPARLQLAGGDQREVELGPCDALVCVVEEGVEEGTRLATLPPAGLAPSTRGTGGAPAVAGKVAEVAP